jgi:type I restriction enzyme S subunit
MRGYIAIDEQILSKKRLSVGDILLERSGGGPQQPVGRVATFLGGDKNQDYICGNFISRLVSNREKVDSRYLKYVLHFWHISGQTEKLQTNTTGIRNLQMSQYLDRQFEIPESIEEQRQVADWLDDKLAEVDKARQGVETQMQETKKLADSIVFDSIKNSPTSTRTLGDVLVEVKNGVGSKWKEFPVMGATRSGLAPAREQPGKNPERYKPVVPGTVFYNPMRILIGSIAFMDNDDKPGITSPDYVALTGKPGEVDSRWFYHWLRSPLGERCINSLARGAVRERMLFNRLAEGEIELPDYSAQKKASKSLAEIKPLRTANKLQLQELELLPQKLLAQFFES